MAAHVLERNLFFLPCMREDGILWYVSTDELFKQPRPSVDKPHLDGFARLLAFRLREVLVIRYKASQKYMRCGRNISEVMIH
jgi:hypothetical protein